MKLYALQMHVSSPEENERRAFEALKRAKEGVFLLPELWLSGVGRPQVEEALRRVPQVLKKLKAFSRKNRLLVAGTLPFKKGGRLYNGAFLIDKGRLAGFRAKRKLFPLFGEDRLFTPGREPLVFKTSFGKVGILICFELRFTELIVELQRERPPLLLVPALWGYARREHLRVLSRARAVELQSYLVLANGWGEHGGTRFAGSSAVYSPWGEVLAFSETGDALLEAEYDPKRVEEVRSHLPVR